MHALEQTTKLYIDLALEQAAQVIDTEKRQTRQKTGYWNYEMALRIVHECRSAIDTTSDWTTAVRYLHTAEVVLGEVRGSNSPCVETAIRLIGDAHNTVSSSRAMG